MKTAIFSTKFYEEEYLKKMNCDANHELSFFEAPLQPESIHLAKGFDAVSILMNDKVDEKTLDELAKLNVRLIALRCAGYDNVDLEAASKKHIKVVRVPAYSPQSVAEHAVALIMALNRKTHKAYCRTRGNNFTLQNLMGFNLYGKTIGVIGTGKIGSAFCEIMLGFGCKVLANDTDQSHELKDKGVRYLPFLEVLEASDVVSIQCPLNDNTRHLFNSNSFSKLKRGAMVINTSRGAIINTEDAIKALKNGQVKYLGIDVCENEDQIFNHDFEDRVVENDNITRLLSFNNVLMTPHQAYFTEEAVMEISKTTIQNLSDFEDGLHLENEIQA